MVDVTFGWAGLLVSYLWRLLALPIHGYFLAAIWLRSQRTAYRVKQGLHDELATFREAVKVVQQLERTAASADLILQASREAMVASLSASLARIRTRMETAFSEELPSGVEATTTR